MAKKKRNPNPIGKTAAKTRAATRAKKDAQHSKAWKESAAARTPMAASGTPRRKIKGVIHKQTSSSRRR